MNRAMIAAAMATIVAVLVGTTPLGPSLGLAVLYAIVSVAP